MSAITDAIETQALEPAKLVIDGVTIENRPVSELIEADKHATAKTGISGTPTQRNAAVRALFVKTARPGSLG